MLHGTRKKYLSYNKADHVSGGTALKEEKHRIILEGNAFYEIDLECLNEKKQKKEKDENKEQKEKQRD